jgi:Ser/Thr protein kinase RdoA (MazF antagonist)
VAESSVAIIAAVVARDYDVAGPVECRWVGHGFNDHYRLTTGDAEFHLRVYLDAKYWISGDSDFDFELVVLDRLSGEGHPVARPVRRRDGQLLTVADLGDGPRRLALFHVAPGDEATSPTAAQCELLGRAIAGVHRATDTFGASGPRYTLDQRYLLQQPLDQLRGAAPGSDDVEQVIALTAELDAKLRQLPRNPPDFGLIHGDLHLGNIYLAANGELTILDFDHSGFGWRAYDLAPLRMSLDDTRWAAVLAGYQSCSPLPAGIDDVRAFTQLRILWDVGDMLTAWPSAELAAETRAGLPELTARLGLIP